MSKKTAREGLRSYLQLLRFIKFPAQCLLVFLVVGCQGHLLDRSQGGEQAESTQGPAGDIERERRDRGQSVSNAGETKLGDNGDGQGIGGTGISGEGESQSGLSGVEKPEQSEPRNLIWPFSRDSDGDRDDHQRDDDRDDDDQNDSGQEAGARNDGAQDDDRGDGDDNDDDDNDDDDDTGDD